MKNSYRLYICFIWAFVSALLLFIPVNATESRVEPGGNAVKPVLAMEKSYEYIDDWELEPELQVSMNGLTVRDDEGVITVYSGKGEDEEEEGQITITFVSADRLTEFMSEIREYEESGLDYRNLFNDEEGQELYGLVPGSYAGIPLFDAESGSGKYETCIGDPVFFDIIPVRMRLSAGRNAEAKKFNKLSKVMNELWMEIKCERVNKPVVSDEDFVDPAPETAELIEEMGPDIHMLLDGEKASPDTVFTSCGTHRIRFSGTVTVAEEYRGFYEIAEYDFEEYGLEVYSDASLTTELKGGRKWYYGTPYSEILNLLEYTYTPGENSSGIKSESLKAHVYPDLKNRCPEEKVPLINAGSKIACRISAENEAGEPVMGEFFYVDIERRKVVLTLPPYRVKRADPSEHGNGFPYKTEFYIKKMNPSFAPVTGFKGWDCPYAGVPLTADNLYENSYKFNVHRSHLTFDPYVPGKYKVSANYISLYLTGFAEKNIILTEPPFTYEILPEYYYSYELNGQLIGKYASPEGETGGPFTYSATADLSPVLPEGMSISGWNFYALNGYDRVTDSAGLLSADSYEAGIDGSTCFTDTDVLLKARTLTFDQSLQIGNITGVGYDGRMHVLSGMKANGRDTVADLSLEIRDGSYTLIRGEDYSVKIKNNKNASVDTGKKLSDKDRPRVEVTGLGDYRGILKKTVYFDIHRRNIEGFDYLMKSPGGILMRENGRIVKVPGRIIRGTLPDGKELRLRRPDYIEEVDETFFIFTAVGRGNYTGSIDLDPDWYSPEEDWPFSFSSYRIRYNKIMDYKETLSANDFGIRVSTPRGIEADWIEEGKVHRDYDLSFETVITEPASSGLYRINITANGNTPDDHFGEKGFPYGTKTIIVRMKGNKLDKKKFSLSWNALDFDGTDHINEVICSDPGMIAGRDYRVSFEEGSDLENKIPGTYYATVTGCGKYANLDKNGNPASFKLVFKRKATAFPKAENAVITKTENGSCIEVRVANADGTQTVYKNRHRAEGWTRTLISEEGKRGFLITSEKNGRVTLKALSASGFSGQRRE